MRSRHGMAHAAAPPTMWDVCAPQRAGSPRWVDGFLAPETCAAILEELRWAYWRPSTVVSRAHDGSLRSATSGARVSETTHEEWFSPRLRTEMRKIERRLAARYGVRPERCEPWQATRYGRGGTFDYHFDSGYWAHEPAGERARTILIYLDTPARGGGTSFRELGLEIAAQRGRLVIWDNLLANGARDAAMLHAGVPVTRGRKTILVTWARERDLRPSIGESTWPSKGRSRTSSGRSSSATGR